MVPILTQHVTTQIEAFSEFNVLNVKEILGATIQMRAVKRLYVLASYCLTKQKRKTTKTNLASSLHAFGERNMPS